jgi:hypothetical protein
MHKQAHDVRLVPASCKQAEASQDHYTPDHGQRSFIHFLFLLSKGLALV